MGEDWRAVDDHLTPLAGDWSLWRDFAIRSAGFAVSGLDVFGAPDEAERLASVAKDPSFATAVIWQNRSAYRSAVANLGGPAPGTGSKRRQREGVVAGYWQRYCSKNDTIGFFGPLAWGTVVGDGPAVAVHAGALVESCEVHFESWCLETLARVIDPELVVPLNRRPERELRTQLEAKGRDDGLQRLDRLEEARDAVAQASGPDEVLAALEGFDATFEELTGAPPTPGDDGAEGGRTPLYLDCMRGLDIRLGPAVVKELASSLPILFEASRWWSGRAFAHARDIVRRGLADGPLEPQFATVFDALWGVRRLLHGEREELQRRVAEVLRSPQEDGAAARAAAVFSDHGSAWSLGVYQSADIQIAAEDVRAIEAGDFLAVVGDFHGGNPLMQSLFSTRHPDPERLLAMRQADVGAPILIPPLRRNPNTRVTSRNIPDPASRDDVQIAGASLVPVHVGWNARPLSELIVEGDQVTDRDGTFRAPLMDLFFQPVFLSALLTFQPLPPAGPRVTVGRTVLRRAGWVVPAADPLKEAGDVSGWAKSLGLPRRAFCLAAGEAKPVYVDFESPALTRNLRRMLTRAAEADPKATARFSEMLPGPDQCWLEQDGKRYTCELRLVAVDETRRGAGAVTVEQRRSQSS